VTGGPPLVSVLMPYRDASATLEDASASILSQAGVALELVAVDDGSRDDGAERMRALAGRDARVVLVKGEGRGIAPALQRGLAAARGEVIARMDSDDVALPGRLARQVEALAADARLGAVGTQVEARGACGEGMQRYVAWQNTLVDAADHARELFVEAPLCHPSVALRRQALEAVGGWHDPPWPEDYDLWLRLDAAGWQLAKVPAVLLQWRLRPGSLTWTDPRYAPERIRDAKAFYLAPRLARSGRPVAIWGAGPTGRRLARALEAQGVRPRRFVDIDPCKVGRTARRAPIVAPEALKPGEELLVVAVGVRGARGLVRAHLTERGFVEGVDFVCAA
jgi:hypothetical protein